MPIARIEGDKYVHSTGEFKPNKETVRWQNPRRDSQVPNHPGLMCKISGVHDVRSTDIFAYEMDGAETLGLVGLVCCQTCYGGLSTEQAVVEKIRKNYERETITQIGSPLNL